MQMDAAWVDVFGPQLFLVFGLWLIFHRILHEVSTQYSMEALSFEGVIKSMSIQRNIRPKGTNLLSS